MYSTTLCFLIKNTPTPQLLLGKKKTGFGKGKYNGFGGKLEAGETPKQAAVREVWEECGIILQENTLQEAGYLEFIFPAAPELDHDVFIYFACEWQGQAVETEEMAPQWFSLEQVPYNQMWKDDIYWLPKALRGETFNGKVWFDDNNEDLLEVQISWK